MRLIIAEGNTANVESSVQISYMNKDYVWIIGRGIFDKSMNLVDDSKAAEIKLFVEAQGITVEGVASSYDFD